MNPASWGLKPVPIGTESWLIFALVLIALVVFIWLITRLVTRATEDSDPAEIDRQMLTAINDLHRKGDLSQEEFRSIKGQLLDRLHEDRKSSAVGSSDEEDHAVSPETAVETCVSTVIETQENATESSTRSGHSMTTEPPDSVEQSKDPDH